MTSKFLESLIFPLAQKSGRLPLKFVPVIVQWCLSCHATSYLCSVIKALGYAFTFCYAESEEPLSPDGADSLIRRSAKNKAEQHRHCARWQRSQCAAYRHNEDTPFLSVHSSLLLRYLLSLPSSPIACPKVHGFHSRKVMQRKGKRVRQVQRAVRRRQMEGMFMRLGGQTMSNNAVGSLWQVKQ